MVPTITSSASGAAKGICDQPYRRGVELNIVHVRTRDFWSQLDAKNVDLVSGSIPAARSRDPALDAYEVIEWRREDLALVTNLPRRELPVDDVDQRTTAPGYAWSPKSTASTTAWRCCAPTSSTAPSSPLTPPRRPPWTAASPADPGRLVRLTSDFDPPLQLLAGIFGRKGERDSYHRTHPLNLLWNAFHAAAPGATREQAQAETSAARTSES